MLLHGTFVLLQSTPAYIVIAADGVTTAPNGQRIFGTCKISKLSPNLFFAATGSTSAISARTGASDFDAHGTAKEVYEVGLGLYNLTHRWSDRMVLILTKLSSRRHPDFLDQGDVMQGIFGGNDADGKLAVYLSRIKYDPLSNSKFTYDIIKERDNTSIGYGGEYREWISELKNNATERAKIINAILKEKIKQMNFSTVQVVALTLQIYVEKVIEWSADPAIGGEVSVLMQEHNKEVEWFHLPTGCRD